jgi:retinol dehydrogenase-12
MEYLKSYSTNLIIASCSLALIILRRWLNGPKTKQPHERVKNKYIVITGASDGIGKEAALQLLKDGASVIFACRDEKKTMNVINSIPSKEERERAAFLQLDLSSFQSVKRFVEDYSKQYTQLDILINNAGAIFSNFTESVDGIEKTLHTNTLGPIILTQSLLPLINKSGGRVINVSSKAYQRCLFPTEYYTAIKSGTADALKNKYSFMDIYGMSKLGNIYYTQYLKEYCEKNNFEKVKTASLHPGVIGTELFRDMKSKFFKCILYLLFPLFLFMSKNVKMGAQTTLHLCYLKDEDFCSGEFYSDCAPLKMMKHGLDESRKRAFMEMCGILINSHGKKSDISLEL